jgi:hypothetical protein
MSPKPHWPRGHVPPPAVTPYSDNVTIAVTKAPDEVTINRSLVRRRFRKIAEGGRRMKQLMWSGILGVAIATSAAAQQSFPVIMEWDLRSVHSMYASWPNAGPFGVTAQNLGVVPPDKKFVVKDILGNCAGLQLLENNVPKLSGVAPSLTLLAGIHFRPGSTISATCTNGSTLTIAGFLISP